jgi:acyl carrier protein
MWDETFERLVRSQLSGKPAGPLRADDDLTLRGLDSMRTVALLVELEQEFGITFPDEWLVPATFATPDALWSAVCRLAPGRAALGTEVA